MSASVMKCKAHGTQQPRQYGLYSEVARTEQHSNSLMQPHIQAFPYKKDVYGAKVLNELVDNPTENNLISTKHMQEGSKNEN